MGDNFDDPVLDGPDPVRPGALFRDGKGVATIQTSPVYWPNYFMDELFPGIDGLIAALFAALFVVPIRRLWWRMQRDRDDRWKVIVLRSPRRFPALWFTHAIEFVADEDEASGVRRRMLGEWDNADYASRRTIGPRRRRAMRLASLRDLPPGLL